MKIFQFGQDIPQYDFKVINERDARASAGIMFLFGIVSFFSFILTQNLFWAELFSITFIIEFIVRVFINPLYAPYMILGSFVVSNQQPEWVEAKPKKFAWILGVMLGFIMAYYVAFDILTPARAMICILCLILLFLESAFGICLGCIVYKRLNMKLYKCPGGVCEVPVKRKNKRGKLIAFLLSISLFYGVYYIMKEYKYVTQEQLDAREFNDEEFDDEEVEVAEPTQNESKQNKECEPPQWAIDMGHREMWLKHHGCL